jgi:hypothetical protein
MFTNNKYHRTYQLIIAKAQNTQRVKSKDNYFEKHHIVPIACGGTNNKSNLVLLTADEHYVCHHLLTKCTQGIYQTKMLFAFWRLATTRNKEGRKIKINNKMYAKLKEQIASKVSEMNTGRINPPRSAKTIQLQSDCKQGDKNPMFGKPAPNRGIKRPGIGGRKKGTCWSNAERHSQLTARSTVGYYNYLSDPARGEKISKSLIGRIGPALGKNWYNNEMTETYALVCPEGFSPGRLKRLQLNKRGLLWYTNGVISKQFKENTQTEGFVRGRVIKK